MSAYEAERQARIDRNHAELEQLGLLGAAASLKAAAGRKRPAAAVAAAVGGPAGAAGRVRGRAADHKRLRRATRSSPRLEGSGTRSGSRMKLAAAPPARLEQPLEHGAAEWAQALFRAAGRSGEGGRRDRCVWDRKRAHQHLTLSPCGAVVATTGCAGYGACLASPPAAESVRNSSPAAPWPQSARHFSTHTQW